MAVSFIPSAKSFNEKIVQSDSLRRGLLGFFEHNIHNQHPPATSILIKGKSSSKTLFLFPDGSGSAGSYASLARASLPFDVCALNCPYVKDPEKLRCAMQDLTPVYLAEIRRRQPQGPYALGGWSAGGIIALDAAQALEREGETVERLVLLDAPCPLGLKRLPTRLFDFLGSINTFGNNERPPPAWLFPHFKAFFDSLDLYQPKPCTRGREPETFILWAKDGVCTSPSTPRMEVRDDDPREMSWMLYDRVDMGPNGWDRLLNPQSIRIETMAGANHFTMTQSENVNKLAPFLMRAMSGATTTKS